jgi:hypothetical protein
MARSSRSVQALRGVAAICGLAIVGASMAVLAGTATLASRFDRVTVIERDELSDGIAPRRGVPQGRHVHAILPVRLEFARHLRAHLDGGWLAPPAGTANGRTKAPRRKTTPNVACATITNQLSVPAFGTNTASNRSANHVQVPLSMASATCSRTASPRSGIGQVPGVTRSPVVSHLSERIREGSPWLLPYRLDFRT